jgi:hypothetical protein
MPELNISNLLRECSARGLRLSVENGRLAVRGPKAAREALREAIRQHRDAIVALLTNNQPSAPAFDPFFQADRNNKNLTDNDLKQLGRAGTNPAEYADVEELPWWWPNIPYDKELANRVLELHSDIQAEWYWKVNELLEVVYLQRKTKEFIGWRALSEVMKMF